MRELLFAVGIVVLSPFMPAMISVPAMAQSDIKVERVSFRPGTSSTTVTRTMRGRETIDFLVNARQGQRLVASMTSNNTAAYYNVIEPGKTDEAVYVGSMSSPLNSVGWTIQKSGDLRIRVYLYRAAARRGESANIRLNISVTGAGGVATQLPGQMPGQGGTASQLPGDALVPGTNYHATGPLDCVTYAGGPVMECQQGVIRLGNGSASVTVRKPDGSTRTITYSKGSPVGYDQSLTRPVPMTWSRQDDQTTVRIGGETFMIPDAVFWGDNLRHWKRAGRRGWQCRRANRLHQRITWTGQLEAIWRYVLALMLTHTLWILLPAVLLVPVVTLLKRSILTSRMTNAMSGRILPLSHCPRLQSGTRRTAMNAGSHVHQ